MDNRKAGTLATLGAVLIEATLLLLVLAIILGISALSRPSGLRLAEQARSAQIALDQAQTAKTLAEASKAQAEGEAAAVTAYSEALKSAASVTMSLFCFVGLPLLGLLALLYYSPKRR